MLHCTTWYIAMIHNLEMPTMRPDGNSLNYIPLNKEDGEKKGNNENRKNYRYWKDDG